MASDDPDRLSPDDARILAVESATITGQTLKLVILDPAAEPLDLEALRARVSERLGSQPRATQRVDTSTPEPRWVEAAAFDIRDHVREHSGPDCASRADLWRIVSALMSEHLDRSRPLWTFDVIGPLEDGRQAIAARLHHAMVDGIAAVRFLDSVLFDEHADAPPKALSAKPVDEPASSFEEVRRLPGAVIRELGHPGSRSPFDRPITIARELAFTGKDIDANRALALGLVSEVFADDDALFSGAHRLAQQIADNPPLVVQGIKRVMNRRIEGEIASGLREVEA